MSYIDYYKILGINKTATEKEIKKAYRKLARKYHPDVNPGNKTAEKKFKEINEANEVLSNPEYRKKYDKYGKDWKHADEFEKAKSQQSKWGNTSGRGQQTHSSFNEGNFSDFFSSMFGNSGFNQSSKYNTPYKGQDYHANLQLNLIDILESGKQTLDLGHKKIRLTIPAGVENGQVIKIKGQGQQVKDGVNGDLFIEFNIINNTAYKRKGNDLYLDLDLDLYKAILGGEIIFRNIDGKKIKLKVRPETQTGTKVKLKGKGMPFYKKDGQFGDLYIQYKIKIPTHLSAKEKGLFNELAKLR